MRHPDEGILCIEVKGGAVKFAATARWYRKEHGDWKPYDKDPFEQAVGRHARAAAR